VKRGFSPLDRRLRLRRGPWSEGVIREAAWLGTTQPSFEIAAETFSRLTGLWISDTTVWRYHQQATVGIERQMRQEEKEVHCPVFAGQKGKVHQPVSDHASVSIDGTTVRIRGEGGREVKMVSVSEVIVRPQRATPRRDGQPATGTGSEDRQEQGQGDVRAAEGDPGSLTQKRGRQDGLKLTKHSYRVVLGDKAAFEPVLVTELARRQVTSVARVTTVNDGGDWIWEMAERLLPAHRVEILDWPHAMQNLAKAGEAAWGEGKPKAYAWLAEREKELWEGRVLEVRTALEQLPERRRARGKAIRQVRDYFAQHEPRLDYQRFREDGRPIGSGTVESAAKNVVGWRMKRGGQSWSRPGATRMLAALGEVHSRRWREAWQRLAKAA
jgi:hypothetical protein